MTTIILLYIASFIAGYATGAIVDSVRVMHFMGDCEDELGVPMEFDKDSSDKWEDRQGILQNKAAYDTYKK